MPNIAIFSLLTVYLSGCTVFQEPRRADSIKLPMIMPAIWPDNWQMTQIDDEPYLYKIQLKDDNNEHSPAYALSLRECGIGKNASAGATTRQMLVGLKEISISREETFYYNDRRIFYKESAAKLDDHSIKLISYTYREDNCVDDSLIWSEDSKQGSVIDWFSGAEPEKLKKIYFAFSHGAR